MIIIEGGDYAGKTTLVNALIKNGIKEKIKDRDKIISKEMILNKDIDIIVEKLYNLIKERYSKDKIYILYNCNKEEIDKRISSRGIQDEYDKNAYEYNLLYKNVFNKLCKRLLNIQMINTENKIVEEIMKQLI